MTSDTRERLTGISTATVSLQLLERGLRNCLIPDARALHPNDCHFVAEAYTLRFIPMREDLSKVDVFGNPNYPPRKAVEEIPTGMALVIDARGELGAGVIGYIFAARMQERSVTAVARDGPMRDGVTVAAFPYPFSAPVSLRRPACTCILALTCNVPSPVAALSSCPVMF